MAIQNLIGKPICYTERITPPIVVIGTVNCAVWQKLTFVIMIKNKVAIFLDESYRFFFS